MVAVAVVATLIRLLHLDVPEGGIFAVAVAVSRATHTTRLGRKVGLDAQLLISFAVNRVPRWRLMRVTRPLLLDRVTEALLLVGLARVIGSHKLHFFRWHPIEALVRATDGVHGCALHAFVQWFRLLFVIILMLLSVERARKVVGFRVMVSYRLKPVVFVLVL